MEQVQFDILLNTFNLTQIHTYLSSETTDHDVTYNQLLQIIGKLSKQEVVATNTIRLLSFKLVENLKSNPSKLFELASDLSNNLSSIQDSISSLHKVSIVILIDLFKHFPSHLNSVSDFTITVIYSKMKKNPSLYHLLLLLASHIIKITSNDKTTVKLIKFCEKQISSTGSVNNLNNLFMKCYYVLLSQLLIKSVGTHFKSLQLKKLNSASLLAQQKQFQMNLLVKYNQIFISGLVGDEELKLTTINMITHVLDSFVPIADFNPFFYLIELFTLNQEIGIELVKFYINFNLAKSSNYLIDNYQSYFNFMLDNPLPSFKLIFIECLSKLNSINDLLFDYLLAKLNTELNAVQYSILLTFVNYISLENLEPILINLLIHPNESIRVESRYYLVNYFTQEYQINKLLLKLFNLFTDLLNHDAIKDNELKLASYSLTITMVFKQQPTSYYSNSIIFKILSFATQNLKNSNNVNEKQYITNYNCWVLLNGLLNLNNEIVVIQKNQFLMFWKNFLKSNDFSVRALNLKKACLDCLLSFMNNFKLTGSHLSQIINLLNKSFAYLTNFKQQFNLKDFESGETGSTQYYYIQFFQTLLKNYLKISYNNKVELNSNLILLCTKYITEDIRTSSKYPNGDLLIKYDLSDLPTLTPIIAKSWLVTPKELKIEDKLDQNYSNLSKFEPEILITLVDYSIEIISVIFPSVSLKIQLSLLEQLRSFTAMKEQTQSIKTNISIVIFNILKQVQSNKIKLNKQITTTILDTLDQVHMSDEEIINLNAESISILLNCNDDKGYATEVVKNKVQQIVETTDPFVRSELVYQISKIYELNSVQFPLVYDILTKLAVDPNPVIHFWCLKSIDVVLESHLNNLQLIPGLLAMLERLYYDDEFGFYSYSNINLKLQYNYWHWFTKIVKTTIISVGPNLLGLPESSTLILKNLIISFSLGIGAELYADYNLIFENLIVMLKDLFIFNPSFLPKQFEFTIELYIKTILQNLNIQSTLIPQVTFTTDPIFISSTHLYQLGMTNCNELLKLREIEISDEKVTALFGAMNKVPFSGLSKLICLIFESSRFDIDYVISYHKKASFYSGKGAPVQELTNVGTDEDDNIIEQDKETRQIELNKHEFKLLVIDLIMNKIKQDSKISESNIHEIIKIVFQSCNSSNLDINLKGIELLNLVFDKFGDKVDPLYPEISILEQQQAQIISSLSALYQSKISSVIIETINVSSKFINLPRIKLSSKIRILNNLTDLLEEVSSSNFNKFEKLREFSEININLIKLSILNCWASIKINYYTTEKRQAADNHVENSSVGNDELTKIFDSYNELLLSMWIFSLREYSMNKYNNENVEAYERYWINYTNILCFEVNNSSKDIIQKILGEELYKFFFILFSQCIESLTKNENTTHILEILLKLIDQISPKVIFNDEFFGEVIDLFDRLILINSIKDKLILVKTCEKLFMNYFDNFKIDENFDKLFEMIRVVFLPVFITLPFIIGDGKAKKLQADDITLLTSSFTSLLDMVVKLPAIIRVDIYTCILETFYKIYEHEEEKDTEDDLATNLLIHLKKIVIDLKSLGQVKVIQTFHQKLNDVFPITRKKISILTYLILINNGGIILDESKANLFVDCLVDMTKENPQLSSQCIKSIIQNDNTKILSRFVPKLINLFIQESIPDNFESLLSFVQTLPDEKLSSGYGLLIPILINSKCESSFKHEKLIQLIKYNPMVFKSALNNNMTELQKIEVESLVKLNSQKDNEIIDNSNHIQLKKFGDS